MKSPGHGERRALDVHVSELVAVPVAPEERVHVPVAEAVDRGRKLALEGEAPHLSVGDHVKAGLLLKPQRPVDGIVLDSLERGRIELAGLHTLLGVEERRWTQQAADDVRAGHEHAPTLRLRRYDSVLASRRGSA